MTRNAIDREYVREVVESTLVEICEDKDPSSISQERELQDALLSFDSLEIVSLAIGVSQKLAVDLPSDLSLRDFRSIPGIVDAFFVQCESKL